MNYIDLNDAARIEEVLESVHQLIDDRNDGYCIVKNNVMSADAFMKIVASEIGTSFTISTGKSGTIPYDTVQDRGGYHDLNPIISGTNRVFPLHTDCCYMERPADVVVLYCIENANEGGESTLLHVNKLLPLLPAAYIDLLLDTEFHMQSFSYRVLEKQNDIFYIRYQLADMLRYARPGTEQQLGSDLSLLTQTVSDPAIFTTFKLGPDECLIVNNRTCLHGRYGFEEGSKRIFLRSRNYL